MMTVFHQPHAIRGKDVRDDALNDILYWRTDLPTLTLTTMSRVSTVLGVSTVSTVSTVSRVPRVSGVSTVLGVFLTLTLVSRIF